MDKLLKIAGFFPFILIVFLNAFVDLGHKIVIQNTVFKIYDGETQVILTAIVNALILLPFILLFSPSGFLSDKYQKPLVMRVSAIAAVVLTLMITISYYQGWFIISFSMTFLLGVQSAFYSPAKYGYIKELVGQERLASMNAIVQSITIFAILAGIFVFSVLFENSLAGQSYQNVSELIIIIAPVGWLLVLFSVLEAVAAFKIPVQQQSVESSNNQKQFKAVDYIKAGYLRTNLKILWRDQNIWLSIVGLSVFWGISQVVLASFPALAKEVLQNDNTVVIQGILACSGIGIVIGSIIAGSKSKDYIETGFVAIGAIGLVVTIFAITQFESVVMMAVIVLLFGIFGGLFIVPLNAMIQFHAKDDQLGTVLAGNNWVQNIVMFSFLVITVLVATVGINTLGIFYFVTVIALLGAFYTIYQLPHSLIRILITGLFAGRYKIQVHGFKNLPGTGGVLMLGNHVSFIDFAMIQIACPRKVRFVMHKAYYENWTIKWFLNIMGVIPIASGASSEALKNINVLLKAGEVVCLFPEGAISRNGQLGDFKHGYEKTVADVDGVILPFYLRGLWGSRFSYSNNFIKSRAITGLRRDVIVAFGEPIAIDSKADVVKRRVFDLSISAWQEYTESLDPIPLAWIKTVKKAPKYSCMADILGGVEFNAQKALTSSVVFSQLIKKRSPEQNVALLLPTSSAGMLVNMAVMLLGKTVVNLNYTASVEALLGAIKKADIKTIYTSTRFVKKLMDRGIEIESLFKNTTVYYLEELKDEISTFKKITTLLSIKILPANLLYSLYGSKVLITNPAAILFSSGSEGTPKGVVLSHQNLMGNIKQVTDVMDLRQDDVFMGSLPQFHAFGLTVSGLLPLIEAVPVVFHPDPTDVVNIAKAISKNKITIMFGTSTFLRLYARNRRVLPLMLESIRLVVAGAEKLNELVRTSFTNKFNKPIYEGYGTTETTPVAGVNIPDKLEQSAWRVQVGNKLGTIGLPVPGSNFRIVDPQTMKELPVKEDGLILIGGTQVMLGYLNDPDKTKEVIVELDGQRWYKTGDKGHVDEDGFLSIVDRYSRFAKIAGEMVSLGAIEDTINNATLEDIEVVSTAIPDDKKGEKVVLLYTGGIEEDDLKKIISEQNLIPIMVPDIYIKVDELPKLGTGKSDFNKAKAIALENI
jgi:acyl-[acyl-carrier-protein]-phospholipid O-acyltransferase/long-chain-fatty-acid--[acyl-carrier-protein] ligase